MTVLEHMHFNSPFLVCREDRVSESDTTPDRNGPEETAGLNVKKQEVQRCFLLVLFAFLEVWKAQKDLVKNTCTSGAISSIRFHFFY